MQQIPMTTESVTTPFPRDVALSVRDLSIDFRLRTHILHAVRGVSFDLRRGETMCLVGESGSGKSVTARALLRIVERPGAIVSGSILLRDGSGVIDVTAQDPGGRIMRNIRGRRIGLIFQEPMSSLSPIHTIGSQIIEAIRLHTRLNAKAARARAIELLRQVEIPNPDKLIDRYTFELSGGMRQRAMIAMALASNPDILIADEPTTALDVTTQAEILDLIKRLQVEHGMAMLLITHDMGIVAEVADVVTVMRFGQVVEQGPVDSIFHASKHPYSRHLVASTLKLEHGAVAFKARKQMVPLLSVRSLTKLYEGGRGLFGGKSVTLRAVDDASLDLYPGENLGIVGESGSGKTTLGRLILRTVEPNSGSVTYRDRQGQEVNVTALNKQGLKHFHRDVRLVFQDPIASLNPRMTVKDVIGDPLVINGLASGRALADKVAALMTLVGLDPQGMERYPHAFSGGQRQRIGIARALALDPRIIIADEATSALDVSIRSQILDLLLDLRRRLGLSFIFISHDISVVRYFCDRVAVMHRGRIVEIGTAEQICTAPREAYTKSLISAVPNPDPRHKRMLHRHRFSTVAAMGESRITQQSIV
jgi:peptide/nickel transport system ATP-binding protein